MATGKKAHKSKRKGKPSFIKRLMFWLIVTAVTAVISAMGVYLFFILNGQKLLAENVNKLVMDEATIIYDRSGKEVTKLYIENREIVSLNDVPDLMEAAFIATEDRRFNKHEGIDFWAIGRALVKDIMHMSAVEGGSTITQQLAKNMFLSSEKTLFRKAREASLAVALESKYTKDEILEMYLNRIYFGNGAYGVKAAAKRYFNKSDLNELTLGEISTLVGIPKSPGNYNPLSDPEGAAKRRAVVLSLLLQQGIITEAQKDEASKETYDSIQSLHKRQDYLTFVDMVAKEASEQTGISEEMLYRGGYKIYTTMIPETQRILEQAFEDDQLFPKDGPDQQVQASMVIVDHQNGGIVAVVGGRDYASKGLNRAVMPRQPGSSFKPVIAYAPAMEEGSWTPYSLLKDEQMSFGSYSPRNYNGKYLGEVSMAYAIQESINIPAVWLLNEVGIDEAMDFASSLGIQFEPEDRNLSIALGGLTKGASPLQMAQAYSAFANHGELNEAHTITKILNTHDQVVFERDVNSSQVMSAKTAYYMTTMLKAAVDSGTGRNARMNRPVAGKTGTTQLGIEGISDAKGNRDAWFVGYTPEWTAAVWMGFDKTDQQHYLTQSSGAPASMFAHVMTQALKNYKVRDFEKPEGVPEAEKPPAPITGLSAVYDPEAQSVMLSFTASEEGEKYQIFRKASTDEEAQMLLETVSNEVRDMTITMGETYQYYIVVYDTTTGIESRPSDTVEVTVPSEGELDPLNPIDPLEPLDPILEPGEGPDVLPEGLEDELGGETEEDSSPADENAEQDSTDELDSEVEDQAGEDEVASSSSENTANEQTVSDSDSESQLLDPLLNR